MRSSDRESVRLETDYQHFKETALRTTKPLDDPKPKRIRSGGAWCSSEATDLEYLVAGEELRRVRIVVGAICGTVLNGTLGKNCRKTASPLFKNSREGFEKVS